MRARRDRNFVCKCEIRQDEIRPRETRRNQTSRDETRLDLARRDEIRPRETRRDQTSRDETRLDLARRDEIRPRETRRDQTSRDETEIQKIKNFHDYYESEKFSAFEISLLNSYLKVSKNQKSVEIKSISSLKINLLSKGLGFIFFII